MSSFVYEARDASGSVMTGTLQAASIEEASRRLRGDGKVVVDLREQNATSRAARWQRVRADDIIFFSNQLAVMIETGVPLTEALDGIAEQTAHTGLKALVGDLAERVKGGEEFSSALARYSSHFGDLYVNMVRASEASGTMGLMLERLCEYLRGQRETRKQIRGAMFYPAGLLCFCVVVLVVMMTFVLPRFERIYEGKSATLPTPTRVLLGASNFMVANWLGLTVGLAAVVTMATMYFRSPAGHRWLGRLRLRVPLMGPLYRNLYISRSMRTLGTMLNSGVGLLDSLQITASVVGHEGFRTMWLGVVERLKEGHTLTEELNSAGLIPRPVVQMISSGERTGKLPNVMNRIADFCESDLRIGIKSMTAMIEPAMIIIMGTMVGGIAISLLLPIFSISKVVAH